MLLNFIVEPRPTGPGVLSFWLKSHHAYLFLSWELPLTLLVSKIFADHHYATLTTNDFALVADLLHAWINLHANFLFFVAN
jgi:hypothetical protein